MKDDKLFVLHIIESYLPDLKSKVLKILDEIDGNGKN